MYKPEDLLRIKEDLKKASPNHWRDFGAVGLGRTKAAAKKKARAMTSRCNLPAEDLAAVEAMIDRRDDFWPH